MNKVKVLAGQSLFDIALQVYGSIEGVFGLTAGTVDELPDPGTELHPEGMVLNKYVVDEYQNSGIKPATGMEIEGSTLNEGIGYWVIEDDFVVS
jgi:hypothetical protein